MYVLVKIGFWGGAAAVTVGVLAAYGLYKGGREIYNKFSASHA